MLRSPTHQIQIYNQYGQFVRKFGANILQHPRGVCVDNKGRIIVVECKVAIKDKMTKRQKETKNKDKKTKRKKKNSVVFGFTTKDGLLWSIAR